MMLTIRRWHAYLGLLIAPSVLFFSLTGALQLFGLHESHGGYKPPALVEKLSSVHKDQEFAMGHHGGPPPAAEASGEPAAGVGCAGAPHGCSDDHDDDHSEPATLLKWYFLGVAVALCVSTGFGVWMGFTQLRRPALAWMLVISGTVLPIALLGLQ